MQNAQNWLYFKDFTIFGGFLEALEKKNTTILLTLGGADAGGATPAEVSPRARAVPGVN